MPRIPLGNATETSFSTFCMQFPAEELKENQGQPASVNRKTSYPSPFCSGGLTCLTGFLGSQNYLGDFFFNLK